MKIDQSQSIISMLPQVQTTTNPLEANFEQTLKGLTANQTKNNSTTLDTEQDKKLKDVCAQFEAVFLYQIMEKARESLPKDELFGESQGENIFKGMLNQEYALNMSQAGGIGLGKMLYDQMSKALKNENV